MNSFSKRWGPLTLVTVTSRVTKLREADSYSYSYIYTHTPMYIFILTVFYDQWDLLSNYRALGQKVRVVLCASFRSFSISLLILLVIEFFLLHIHLLTFSSKPITFRFVSFRSVERSCSDINSSRLNIFYYDPKRWTSYIKLVRSVESFLYFFCFPSFEEELRVHSHCFDLACMLRATMR